MKEAVSHAKIQVTIEVPLPSVWGSSCTIEQVHKQAGVEGIAIVERLIRGYNEARIIGTPKVISILLERDK